MNPVPADALACPSCGYNGSQQNPDGLLPIGSRIGKGKYLIGRAEEIHTECVDYIGFDVSSYRRCTVREFLPAGGITRMSGEMSMQPLEGAEKRFRAGLNRFASEYGAMRDLPDDCSVPKVRDLIQQNGTVYAVIEKFSGMTLRELLRRNGGTLSVEQTKIVMDPVMDALEAAHSMGLYHGNLSPDNILINTNGDVRVEEFHTGERPLTQKAVGFCSPECESGEKASPNSDVYSIGAVFYRCVIGRTPQDALQRKNFDTLTTMTEVSEDVPEEVSAAVWNAMLVNRDNRTSSVADFRSMLEENADGEPADTDAAEPEPEFPDPASEKDRKKANRWRFLAIMSAGLLLVMTAVYFGSLETAKRERARRRAEELNNLPDEILAEAPDYLGLQVTEAEFDRMSFDFVIVSTYVEGKEPGVIVGQDPHPGTQMSLDHRTIMLFVNRSKDTTAVVPDLRGLYVPNAEQLLKEYGIKYTVVFKTKEGEFQGLVYDQSVEPKETITLSDTLTITAQPDPSNPAMRDPDAPKPDEVQSDTGQE